MSNSSRSLEEQIAHCYSTWGESYYRDYYTGKAAYPPVHREIIRSLLRAHRPKTLLDAGCGPASLLRDLGEEVPNLYGFDLTPEMVTEAKRIFKEKGWNPNQVWQGSVLDQKAFTAPTKTINAFDAAICIGVYPHVPVESDEPILRSLISSVNPGGLVIVEARNQFFSLFTLNRYSYEFFVNELIRPEELLKGNPEARAPLEGALTTFQKQFRMDLPPVRGGHANEPGYDQVLSRTHNPLVLKSQAEAAGLRNVEILYYHYHCLPPMLGNEMPEFFREQSLAMENPYDWRGIFLASAFLIVGHRA